MVEEEEKEVGFLEYGLKPSQLSLEDDEVCATKPQTTRETSQLALEMTKI